MNNTAAGSPTVDVGSEENVLKLSVVIPTYNGAAYIDRCLDSFTRQSLDSNSYEIIIVDNNSVDDTPGVIARYVEKHNNFISIKESRQGVNYARNTGTSRARGKYICFIDDDAYADSRWLEGVLNAFETVEPAPVVVGGDIFPYYVVGKPVWFKDAWEIRSYGGVSCFLSEKNCSFGFAESNYCIRKKILDEVGSFSVDLGPKAEEMRFGEGVELSGRVAAKYPQFWYDPQLIVYHLVPVRNMSIRYILTRKFKMAYNFQAYESAAQSTFKNLITLSICLGRAGLNLLLSLVWVRWFSKQAIADWLSHMIPCVCCAARSLYILQFTFCRRFRPRKQHE